MSQGGVGDNDGMPERAVLIVEDSENCASTLEVALAGIPGVMVLTARSGVEALGILSGRAVKAIVTDLNMPRMDGFELIRRVRESKDLAGTPVVVVSGDTDPETPARVARMGVSAFFAKPYSPSEVRRRVEQILNVTCV